MKIVVAYNSPEGHEETCLDIDGDLYVLNLKEKLAVLPEHNIASAIRDRQGPYSPSVVLSYKNIEMNNMFHLSKYCISENDHILLSFEETVHNHTGVSGFEIDADKNAAAECSACGRSFSDRDMLKYHSGRLSPQEWVYGLTVKWKWSCCGNIVSTPESCYHPEGCCFGICPDCRKTCACYQARNIRRNEEENF